MGVTTTLSHLDLFSGIGGFALATEMVWNDVEHVFCDNDQFSQAILKKHWPQSKIYGDIRRFTKNVFTPYAHSENTGGIPEQPRKESLQNWFCGEEPRVDILTGGFPCQPFSQAGRRRGTEDDRHLWPEMLRVIREFHPRWVIGENVGGLITWGRGMVLEQVHTDLESEGYEVQAFIIPAVSLNAPHRRDRVWIVAHSISTGARSENGATGNEEGRTCKGGGESLRQTNRETSAGGAKPTDGNVTNARQQHEQRDSKGMETDTEKRSTRKLPIERGYRWNENWLEVATELCTVDDGLPNGLARPRGWRNAALKGAGNAIVPQVAAEIMKVIKHIDNEYSCKN